MSTIRFNDEKTSVMHRMLKLARRSALVALLLVGSAAGARAQGYKVIVNASNASTRLSKSQVAALFLKKTDRWSSGAAAVPVDLKDDAPAREAFSKKVLGRSTTAVLAYWTQMVFSGRNVPPATRPSEADVVAFVRSTPGAIGYVSESTPASGVAVVTIE